jgi:hypothetical protein
VVILGVPSLIFDEMFLVAVNMTGAQLVILKLVNQI